MMDMKKSNFEFYQAADKFAKQNSGIFNVIISHKYNRYYRMTDPFYIGTNRNIKLRIENKRKMPDPQRFFHWIKNDISDDGYNYFIEFKIINNKLLEDIKNNKDIFKINRYVPEWKTGDYFLQELEGVIHLIDNNIVVFKVKCIKQVNEKDLKIILRNDKIDSIIF